MESHLPRHEQRDANQASGQRGDRQTADRPQHPINTIAKSHIVHIVLHMAFCHILPIFAIIYYFNA